jgi:hypothetical protein
MISNRPAPAKFSENGQSPPPAVDDNDADNFSGYAGSSMLVPPHRADSCFAERHFRRWSMQAFPRKLPLLRGLLCGIGLSIVAASTGCQVDPSGQTLPSPYYLKDDVQYFPPGPEFKLSREAAAQKLYTEEQAQRAPQ